MSRKINIEGRHLRWFVQGALLEQFRRMHHTDPVGADFDYNVSDTCNRVHKYLTTGGREGTDGTASDMQCCVCTDAWMFFGRPSADDEVTIYW